MRTECERVQTAILESFDESGGLMRRPDVDRHIRGCSSCLAFAQRHDALDTALARSLSPPSLSMAFRASLRRQVGCDITSKWHERLPDIMHVSGCGVVVMIYATLVPADLPITMLVGLTGTLVTYAVLSMARTWFEDVDCC